MAGDGSTLMMFDPEDVSKDVSGSAPGDTVLFGEGTIMEQRRYSREDSLGDERDLDERA